MQTTGSKYARARELVLSPEIADLSEPQLRRFATSFRSTPIFFLGAYYLVISLTLQGVLFVAFGMPSGAAITTLPELLAVGCLNGAIEACYILLPLSLYLAMTPTSWQKARVGRIVLITGVWTYMFFLMYLSVVQFFFFEEFNGRFNLVAVDYLIYPHEVFVNIFESYPVVSIVALAAILTTVLLRQGLRFFPISNDSTCPFSRKLVFLCAHAVVATGCALFFSTHSFDFSDNRVINEIAADGLSSFFEALKTNELDYKQFYRTRDSQQMKCLLASQLATDPSRSYPDISTFNRSESSTPGGLGKMNVVVIVEESFGCEHVDACGQGLGLNEALASVNTPLTPHFDALARQGYFFSKAYATGTRTVRGLEAITASFPPIPSESIIKQPGGEHIATWGKVMRENGYHTSFLYGGYSQFDNMKAFYAGNGFEVSDRLDIDRPRFANIWGVSDQDLFRHAQEYFDERSTHDAPFFSIIMTTSNHSPYTFPDGIEGVLAKGGGRKAGVKYADYALGQFFANIRNSTWCRNTLFVVVADHGARVYGSEQFPLGSYEIPLLLLAPGHLQARELSTPISQIDIAPTVLGLLGLEYRAPFFGQNVLAQGLVKNPLLFNHNHDVALYQDGKLAVLGLQKTAQTYRYNLGGRGLDKVDEDLGLTDLATAYYQTAFDLFTQHTD